MVEFGIVLALLISIVFGITEFGRAVYQYNNLAKAARDAARYLSIQAATDVDAKNAAKCLAVYGRAYYGDASCGGAASPPPLVPGLATAMISICDPVDCPATHLAQGAAPVLNLVTVTVSDENSPYPFTSLISFVVPSFNFGEISVTMKQVL